MYFSLPGMRQDNTQSSASAIFCSELRLRAEAKERLRKKFGDGGIKGQVDCISYVFVLCWRLTELKV